MDAAAARRILVATLWREGDKPETTHDCRSRQLQTNLNHASLPQQDVGVTREYQFDSPSIIAVSILLEFSRDGPKKK